MTIVIFPVVLNCCFEPESCRYFYLEIRVLPYISEGLGLQVTSLLKSVIQLYHVHVQGRDASAFICSTSHFCFRHVKYISFLSSIVSSALHHYYVVVHALAPTSKQMYDHQLTIGMPFCVGLLTCS